MTDFDRLNTIINNRMIKAVRPDDILIAIAHYLPQGRRCFRYGAEKLTNRVYNHYKKNKESK